MWQSSRTVRQHRPPQPDQQTLLTLMTFRYAKTAPIRPFFWSVAPRCVSAEFQGGARGCHGHKPAYDHRCRRARSPRLGGRRSGRRGPLNHQASSLLVSGPMASRSRDEGLPRDESLDPKLKRTFYLDRRSVVALSTMQVQELRDTGRKPDLSELVCRGIRLLERAVE